MAKQVTKYYYHAKLTDLKMFRLQQSKPTAIRVRAYIAIAKVRSLVHSIGYQYELEVEPATEYAKLTDMTAGAFIGSYTV